MAGYEGWKNYATWRLYTTLHREWEFSSMIEDWLVQWAKQGYSKHDATNSLYGEISMLVYSDYEDACANSSQLIQDLMMKDPFKMDIDWDAITDRFMEDYEDIVKKYGPKASNNRKSGTASGRSTRSKAGAKAPAKRTIKATPRRR